jgi:hypothetical protein
MNASTLAEIRKLLIQVQGAAMALDIDPNVPMPVRFKSRFIYKQCAHVLDLLSLEAAVDKPRDIGSTINAHKRE